MKTNFTHEFTDGVFKWKRFHFGRLFRVVDQTGKKNIPSAGRGRELYDDPLKPLDTIVLRCSMGFRGTSTGPP